MNSLKFEGKGFEFFKIYFVNVILTILSLTFLYPWAKVRKINYLCRKTFLAEKPFIFTGGTKEFFKGYIKTFLASLILIVIYIGGSAHLASFQGSIISVVITMVSYVILLGLLYFFAPLVLHGSLNYRLNHTLWGEVRSSYTGELSKLVSVCFIGSILTTLTAGIYGAWYLVKLLKYLLQHIRFGSLSFDFNGESKDLFLLFLKGFFLSLITFGIYGIWFTKQLYEYSVKNIVVKKGDHEFKLSSNANSLEVFELIIGNFLLIFLTLGIGTSWAYMRYYRFIINHCIIPEEFNISFILDTSNEVETTENAGLSKNWLDKWNPTFIA